MSLGTLSASLLGNMLTGKGIIRAGYGSEELQAKNFQSNKEKVIIAGYEPRRCLINKDF